MKYFDNQLQLIHMSEAVIWGDVVPLIRPILLAEASSANNKGVRMHDIDHFLSST